MNMHTITQGPHLYDRWEDQVALEQEMLATGKERMQEKINKAIEKQDMLRLRPHRTLMKDFLEPVAEDLKAWIDGAGNRRGPKPIALPRLKQVDPYVAAVIGLRSVMRLLGRESRKILPMAYEIGTWVEHEVEAALWMEMEPDSWNAMEYGYRERGSTADHIKRSRVAVFNRHIANKIDYEPWTEEEKRRVGLQVIDSIVKGTGRFRLVADMTAAANQYARKRHWPTGGRHPVTYPRRTEK